MADNLNQFDGKPFLNLETFRRNGQGVRTPVWFTQDGGMFYVRTVAGSGKVKRVRNKGTVRIVPCEADGTPTGEWAPGHAVEVTDEGTAELVAGLLEKKYGEERVRQFAAATTARGDKYTVLKIELK